MSSLNNHSVLPLAALAGLTAPSLPRRPREETAESGPRRSNPTWTVASEFRLSMKVPTENVLEKRGYLLLHGRNPTPVD